METPEIVLEILIGLSAVATAVFPTVREYFLAKSSEISTELRSAYLNVILQILIVMIYINLLNLLMLGYIYYRFNKSINPIYFGIALTVILSSLITNIISVNIQISKYDLDVNIFNKDSMNNALHGDKGILSLVTRILSVVVLLIILTVIFVGVLFYSEKIRDKLDNYLKKLTFQKFFKDSELKQKQINSTFGEDNKMVLPSFLNKDLKLSSQSIKKD
jgi:hypothetical protein